MSDSQGNASSYLTRRIARDRPDFLERMKQGEYKSVRAAAIEAGIVHSPSERAHLRPRRALLWAGAGGVDRPADRRRARVG